jgi:pimeloyl-ACP methyl ester carboxylesterase
MLKVLRRSLTSARELAESKAESFQNRSAAILFKSIFTKLDAPTPTTPITPSLSQFQMIRACCLLARQTYLKRHKRKFLPELGEVVFDQHKSKKYWVPFFIMNSAMLNRIFVACRGTYSLSDFIVDIQGAPLPWTDGFVHAGVLKTAQNMYRVLRSFISSLSQNFGRRPVTIVGHSLGGSVASLLCEMFAMDFPEMDVTSVVFAPAASVTQNLWVRSLERCNCFVADGDFVPFMSLYNFESLPPGTLPSWIDSIVRRHVKKQMAGTEVSRWNYGPQRSIPLYPPGDLHLLIFPSMGKRLVPALGKIESCEYFLRMPNNLKDLRHAMSVYLNWASTYGEVAFGMRPIKVEVEDDY